MSPSLAQIKEWLDLIQGILTIIAIIAGAIWFWHRRQKLPRAKATHEIQGWRLSDGRWLLRVCLSVENLGEVLLELEYGFTRVQQMRPWPEKLSPPPEKTIDRETEVAWPKLAEMEVNFEGHQREIEPHEGDTIPFEFVLPAATEMVVVYTYIRNKSKRFEQSPFATIQKEIGWSAITVYELKHTVSDVESLTSHQSQP